MFDTSFATLCSACQFSTIVIGTCHKECLLHQVWYACNSRVWKAKAGRLPQNIDQRKPLRKTEARVGEKAGRKEERTYLNLSLQLFLSKCKILYCGLKFYHL